MERECENEEEMEREKMNQEQGRDFKRRSADLASLMLKQRYSFLVCCFLLAASIYGLSRECREHLNIHCLYEKIILDQSGCEKALQLVTAWLYCLTPDAEQAVSNHIRYLPTCGVQQKK